MKKHTAPRSYCRTCHHRIAKADVGRHTRFGHQVGAPPRLLPPAVAMRMAA
jgi:hypothetical protein